MVNFAIENWTYLGIDILIVFARLSLRWRNKGFRGLAADDFLMVLALIFYAAEAATAHYVGAYWYGMANTGMTDAEREALDPSSHEYYLRVEGSKTALFGWAIYICLLWTLKVCWLCFYQRLGSGVNHMTLKINIGFAFVASTFFITIFIVLFGCNPIEKHWQINPNPGNSCQAPVSQLAAWTLIITNLTTDVYIMTIPLPMVWNARISGLQKAGLGVMFGGGIITAIFGGLRCGFILENSPNAPQLAGEWSCRESFVAVFISNVPVLFPLLRIYYARARGLPGSFDTSNNGGAGSVPPGDSKTPSRGPYKMSTISSDKKRRKYQHPLSLPQDTFYERYGSEEEIIGDETQTRTHAFADGKPPVNNGRVSAKGTDGIVITTEWQVRDQGRRNGDV